MEDRYSLDHLTSRVKGYFIKHAGKYGLDRAAIEARYILNWGGFVNASFQITDGKQSYHLKLADEEWSLDRLARWQQFNFPLSQQYHAPRMLDWIKLPRLPFEGPLFEFIPGQKADLIRQPEVLQGVLSLLAKLHNDQKLAAELEVIEGEVPTCGNYFMDVYIDRFDGDLLVVAPNLPPFVSLETLSWMMGETRELEALARELPVFQYPAQSPTHSDLNNNNVLVTPAGEWYIIDWDDLSLGDPALDYNIFLGPLWRSGQLSQDEVIQLLPEDMALRERFLVCQRALLLDEVIDSLADWVEAEITPEHLARVRTEKERIHRAALELYQSRY